MSTKVPKQDAKSASKKLLKHPPPRVFKYSNILTSFRLKSSTPFVSAVKHIDKKFLELDQPKNKNSKKEYITVYGMGKTVEKCLSVGLYFQDTRQHKIEVRTTTVKVLDELQQDDEVEFRKRSISGVEIDIYRKDV